MTVRKYLGSVAVAAVVVLALGWAGVPIVPANLRDGPATRSSAGVVVAADETVTLAVEGMT
jgi:hypothetical protein